MKSLFLHHGRKGELEDFAVYGLQLSHENRDRLQAGGWPCAQSRACRLQDRLRKRPFVHGGQDSRTDGRWQVIGTAAKLDLAPVIGLESPA